MPPVRMHRTTSMRARRRDAGRRGGVQAGSAVVEGGVGISHSHPCADPAPAFGRYDEATPSAAANFRPNFEIVAKRLGGVLRLTLYLKLTVQPSCYQRS